MEVNIASKTLQLIVEFENNKNVFDYRFECDDVLMWPYIRWPLSLQLDSIIYPSDYLSMALSSRKWYHLVKYICGSYVGKPSIKNNDSIQVVIFGSGVGNHTKRDCYFNRLTDYFYFQKEESTLVIEDSFHKQYKIPRCIKNISYHDWYYIRAAISRRLKKLTYKDKKSIDTLMALLRTNFNEYLNEDNYQRIENILTVVATSLPTWYKTYNKLFTKAKPKLVMLEDAAYGSRSHIIKWAKNHNIPTAEYQHGMISHNHVAYNYKYKAHNKNFYNQYLPDYYLLYGKYWSEQICFPSKKIIIGNPYYSESILRVRELSKSKKPIKKILFLSTGLKVNIVKQIILELRECLDVNIFEIFFRPHPGERRLVTQRYGDLINKKCFQVDTTEDLYDSIFNSDYVVGDCSTAVFEAMGLCEYVYIIDHEYTRLNMPIQLFNIVKSGKELSEKIQKSQTVLREVHLELKIKDIWANDWKNNYLEFLDYLNI